MHNPGQILPFLETDPLHINGNLEDFDNSLNLYVDQNKMILGPEENETVLNQKIVKMLKENLGAYLQQSRNDSEVLRAENWSLIEQNEELKKQIQAFSDAVSEKKEENCETEQEVVKIEVKTEEENESPCNCLVCKLFEAGEIIIEEENEGKRLIRNSLFDCASFCKKQQQNMMEEAGQNFEEEHQKLLKNFEQLEAAKLSTDDKLIEVEVKNQELLKILEERERTLSSKIEILEKSAHNNQEKMADMRNIYKEICQNYEKLEAAKLIIDEKLVRSEDKNQQLEADKSTLYEELNQFSMTILKLIKMSDAQEDTLYNEIETLVKKNDEMVIDMKSIYKEICQNYEKLEAAKLIVDEKLAQAEDQNQNQALLKKIDMLEAAKLIVDEKIVQSEDQNQELLKTLDELKTDQKIKQKTLADLKNHSHQLQKNLKKLKAKKLTQAENRNKKLFKSLTKWERDILCNKESSVKARVDLANKTQELIKVTKEKEEISQLLEQRSQDLIAFQSESKMTAYFAQERLWRTLKNNISILESVNESLRDQISTFRIKTSNLLYQMSSPLRLAEADFKFDLNENDCIHSNLKQLTLSLRNFFYL